MIGKRIKVNDFEFKYGEETVYINVYGAFKYKKNGNKYVVYSYNNNYNNNNKKLHYGSLFIRDKELVIMLSKNDKEDIICDFLSGLLDNNVDNRFEVISLDNINSAQIIDSGLIDKIYDVDKLYDITIPKEIVKEDTSSEKKKKSISISSIFFMLFLLVVGAFFFFNPEVLIGDDKEYSCTKEYNLKEISSSVKEEVNIIFRGNGKIKEASIDTYYVFNSISEYNNFKDNGKFYKYMNEGDTYKFIDEEKTFRVITKIDNMEEYFSFDTEDNLIDFYKNNKYECKVLEVE